MASIQVHELIRSDQRRVYQSDSLVSLVEGTLAFGGPDGEDAERFKLAGPVGMMLVETLRAVPDVTLVTLNGKRREIEIMGKGTCNWEQVRDAVIAGLQRGHDQPDVTLRVAACPVPRADRPPIIIGDRAPLIR